MRDPRVDNLARILVGYSTEVKEGDTCVIEGPTAGEPLIAAVYEEVLAAGGQPGRRAVVRGPAPRPSSSALRRPARVGLADSPSGRPRRPTAGSRSAPTPTPASSRGVPPSARRSAGRRRGS